VDIYDGTLPVAGNVAANVYRADLYSAGYGNGVHGFSYATPASLKNGAPHYITVKFAGTNANLGASGWYAVNCMAGATGYQPYYSDTFATIDATKWTTSGQWRLHRAHSREHAAFSF
jgi:hypothetical protein